MKAVAPSAAIGVELRRWARRLAGLAIASFLLLLMGALVALLVFERYQPLDSGGIIRSFSIGLLALWLLLAWKTWDVLRNPGKWLGARLGLLLPAVVPWAFAAFLWLNGAVDRTLAAEHATVVVAKHISSRDWLHAFRYEVVVRSWRPGRRFEGVLVRERERFETYQRGDAVAVEVRPGFFGLAWIASLKKIGPASPDS